MSGFFGLGLVEIMVLLLLVPAVAISGFMIYRIFFHKKNRY